MKFYGTQSHSVINCQRNKVWGSPTPKSALWPDRWGVKSVKDTGNLRISYNLDYKVVTPQRTIHTPSPHHASFRNIHRRRISTSASSLAAASCNSAHVPSSSPCLSCKSPALPAHALGLRLRGCGLNVYNPPTSLEPSDPSQQLLLGSKGESSSSPPSVSFLNLGAPSLFSWKSNVLLRSFTGFLTLVWTIVDSIYSDSGNDLPGR